MPMLRAIGLTIALIIILILANLTSPPGAKADDPNFCLEGWELSEITTTWIGDHMIVEKTYICPSTNLYVDCLQLSNGEESCNDAHP